MNNIYKHKEFIIERKISSDEQLNEGFKEIIMSIALLTNISLGNQNKAIASEFIKNNPDKIENSISNKSKLDKISDVLDISKEKIKKSVEGIGSEKEEKEEKKFKWTEDSYGDKKSNAGYISKNNFLKLIKYYNVNNPNIENLKGKKIYLFKHEDGIGKKELHQKGNINVEFKVNKIDTTKRFVYLLSGEDKNEPFLKITKKNSNMYYYKNRTEVVRGLNNHALKQFFKNLH